MAISCALATRLRAGVPQDARVTSTEFVRWSNSIEVVVASRTPRTYWQVEGIVEDLVLDGEITDGPAQENLYAKGHDTLRRELFTTTFAEFNYSISMCREGH